MAFPRQSRGALSLDLSRLSHRISFQLADRPTRTREGERERAIHARESSPPVTLIIGALIRRRRLSTATAAEREGYRCVFFLVLRVYMCICFILLWVEDARVHVMVLEGGK